MDFGKELREERRGKGLSQASVAGSAKISICTLYELEVGRGDLLRLDRVVESLDMQFVGLPRAAGWGERCRTLRARKGWSLARVAEAAGITVPSIQRLERGENVHVRTLSAVLRMLAPRARRRKPQTTALGHKGSRDMRFTPEPLLANLHAIFGSFDLDPCGHPDSPVVAGTRFFGGPDDDGLKLDWHGAAYCNPPFSVAQVFAKKCHDEWMAGRCRLVVALLPARTHTTTFHEVIAGVADVFFLHGRFRFDAEKRMSGGAPFGIKLCVWGATDAMVTDVLKKFRCVHIPTSAARRASKAETANGNTVEQMGRKSA
jgi:transcriptional regulator with XRE-family HTH domain